MKFSKKLLSLLLCAVMVLGSVVIGGNGFAEVLDAFSVKASAASYSDGTGSNDGWADSTHIRFGSYPQTDVTASMGKTLDAKATGWKSYKYYSGTGDWRDGQMSSADYMMYCDVTVMNGSVPEKYRGVKFNTYRPSCTGHRSTTSADFICQYDNGYTVGNTYWFKYEPLVWRVLDSSTGLVMCESIIDSQAYNNYIWYDTGSYEYYGNEAHTNYANDYYNSSIRKWLNDDFYNTAFSESQQNNLLKYNCDNSVPWTSSFSSFDSQNSSDKVFLLSYDEVKNTEYGFNSDEDEYDPARRAKGTDYAKCQGLDVCNEGDEYDGNSFWWLRSPYDISGGAACAVSYDGGSGLGYGYGVYATPDGVRPALKLNLTSINELAVIDFDGKENNDTNAIEKAKKQTEAAAENSKKTIIIISAISALILLAAAAILIIIFKTDKAKAIPQEEVYTEPQEKYSSTTRIEFDETPKTKEPAGPTVRQAESEIKLSCVKCEAGGICSMCKSETEQLYSITASKNGRSQTVTVCRSCAEEIVSKYKK